MSFSSMEPAGHFADKSRIDSGILRVHYSAPDKAIAEESVAVLQKALAEFEAHLPAGDAPLDVVICRTLAEFEERAGAYGRAQVGGIARAQDGVIIVKSPNMLPEEQDYRGILRHELLHVLVARNCDPAFVPRWFDEGIAMVLSREMRWQSSFHVAKMYMSHRLISYYDLDFAFAPVGDEATFDAAYAEALSLTEFLRSRIGDDVFWELVHSMKKMDFEEAIRLYAHLSPAELYDAWHESLWKIAIISSLVSGFGVFQFMAFLVIIAYIRKRRRNQRTLREWDEEEGFHLAMSGGSSGGNNIYRWEDILRKTCDDEEGANPDDE